MGGINKLWAVSLLLLLTNNAFGLVSDDYVSYDQNTPERQVFVRDENRALNKILSASKNYKSILNTIYAMNNQPTLKLVGGLSDGSFLVVKDMGLSGLEKLIIKTPKEETVLLSLSDLKLGNNVSLTQSILSPTKEWVVLLISVNGAITDYKMVVYDIKNKKIAKEFTDQSFSTAALQWVAPDTFIVSMNKTGTGVNWFALNLTTDQSKVFTTEELLSTAQRTSNGEMVPEAAAPESAADAFKKAVADITGGVVQVTSKDGTQVPIVMRYLKSTVKNGKNPVLIKSYGGFGVNYLGSSQPNLEEVFFLLRGGILVHTGLRGGGELGAPWMQQGSGAQNKIKTYEDLIAVAQNLVIEGWTAPEKIVSTGTSNGGLTVAAAALLSPGTFGLVIPIAGVLDVIKFPTLDPNYVADWSGEYGNPSVLADLEALEKISPVENVANQGTTKFLVMAGSTDDRVNVAHSVKFYAALKERGGHPENAHLSITMNAGHALTSVEVGGIKGWTSSSAYWTFIYDHLGMQF